MAIFDVPANELIVKTAELLKSESALKPPAWAPFVKTGVHKERPPIDEDWWYTRTASMMRKLQVLGPIGTSKFRRYYGGRKNEGNAPENFYKGSGNITRKILQQLEKAGFAKQAEKGVHKGRVLTPKGMSVLEKVSAGIMKEKGVTLPKKPEAKPKKTRKKVSKTESKKK